MVTIPQRVRSTDEVELALHHFGGDGDPLVIFHATGFCGGAYEPLGRVLAEHHDVWAIDFRGHGDSSAPASGDFAWSGMAADVAAAVRAITDQPVHAFGHSMGGAVALYAERETPGLLRSAFLFEPIVTPPDFVFFGSGPDPLSVSARRRQSVFASRAEALDRYASRPPLNVLRADSLAAYVEYGFADRDDGQVELKCTTENEARTFETSFRITVDKIVGVTIPTVVAVGAADNQAGPAALGPGVVAALPHARLLEFPNLGHFGPLQDPLGIGREVLGSIGS